MKKVFTALRFSVLFLFISINVYAQNTYYVSSSGNDGNSGTSSNSPWRTVRKVNDTNFQPGDRILFRSGDRWNEELLPRSSGSSGRLITFSSYGSGNMPIISPSGGNYAINIRIRSYLRIEGIHAIAPNGASGIAVRGNAVGNEIINCKVQGSNGNSGIVYTGTLEGSLSSATKVIGNEVFGFFQCIYGYGGFRGSSGIIENNTVYNATDDGIVARRGDFKGMLIRNNKITRWRDDAIDLYGGINIIVEKNDISTLASSIVAGNGIKAGGGNAVSENVTVRYNKIYNLRHSSSSLKNGITMNGGDKAKIYGNLIYDIDGQAITVPSGSDNIEIYNNTAIADKNTAIYVGASNGTSIRNNILWGRNSDVNINASISASNNLLITGTNESRYNSSNDVRASASDVFAGHSSDNYKLKSSSPAIDRGISISGFTAGIAGVSISGRPDIGAYQYGNSSNPDPEPEPEPEPDPEPNPEPSPGDDAANGLNYAYYEGGWSNLPNFSNLQTRKTGTVSNYTLSPRLRNDNYGFVFTGYIKIENSGTYTFYTSSDDGSRLFINNNRIVNNDGLHPKQERSGTVSLSAGYHAIRVEFFERTSGEALEVRYAGPGVSKRLIPSNVLYRERGDSSSPSPDPEPEPEPSGDATNGLNYAYYEGSWSNLPNFSNLQTRKTGTVSNYSLSPRLRNDNYGFVFTGYIKIENSGSYTFYTSSDDGSSLFIDGNRVVNNDGLHGKRERSGSVNLSSGFHAIRVEFFERTSLEVLEVRYAGPGVSKRLIPSNVLYRESGSGGSSSPSPEPEPSPGDDASNGLNYAYYEGTWSSMPNFSNLQARKTGTVSNYSLAPRMSQERFGFVFTGYIKIENSGNYTFYTTSDDGSELFINGSRVVNNDGVHAAIERSGTVNLSSGYHAIRVEFFERTHGEVLEVRYAGPGVSKRTIPSNVLFLNRPSNARVASNNKGQMIQEELINEEVFSDAILQIYPVPFEEYINIDLSSEEQASYEVTINNITGKNVFRHTYQIEKGYQELTLETFNIKMSGIYILSIYQNGELKTSKKIIKK